MLFLICFYNSQGAQVLPMNKQKLPKLTISVSSSGRNNGFCLHAHEVDVPLLVWFLSPTMTDNLN